ncbi:unnamed protein product [Heterobilharzia americana]|nr:unnamed protein product [Heterobilharzia americana]
MFIRFEASSEQIIKPIHTDSLDAWSKDDSAIPMKYINFMNKNSVLLNTLGYLTDTIPPNYEELCYS